MPAIRNPANADLICERIVEGFTLRQVAAEIGCTSGAIAIWASEDEDFAKRYARALDFRTDRMADDLLDIADDSTNDWVDRERDEDGNPIRVIDHEHIQRAKLRVDTRKWLMAKMMPKKYGERAVLAGDPDAPLNVAMTIEDKRAATKAVLDAAFGEKPE